METKCAYCNEGELLDAFGVKICELEQSKVYLFREQSHTGRVIVAHKKHVSELIDLTPEERSAYFEEIAHVSKAIHKAFHPQKVNYGAYGDTGCHLHFHLVPKYEDEFEWGDVFAMNPKDRFLPECGYEKMVEAIKRHL